MIHRNMEDKRMKATIENKSGVTLHGLKPGGQLVVDVDQDGTPLDRNWRRRVADSAIDGAVSIVKPKTKKKKTGGE